MIQIYFTIQKGILPPTLWERYFLLLPKAEQEKNRKFKRWEDRQSHLFGKLLLRKVLLKRNFPDNVLEIIQLDPYKRPYINKEMDFNISHSGSYVLCAFSDKCRLGIDIEMKAPLTDIRSFREVLCDNEWNAISGSGDAQNIFYKIWTRKESLIKADGRGMNMPLSQLDCLQQQVQLANTKWFIHDLNFSDGYAAALTTDQPATTISYISVDFYGNFSS